MQTNEKKAEMWKVFRQFSSHFTHQSVVNTEFHAHFFAIATTLENMNHAEG